MIYIALGANLPSVLHGSPQATLEAALAALEAMGIRVVRRSRWYRSAPVPVSNQPDFINGVAAIETELKPIALLARLHGIEGSFGRVRRELHGPRFVDLDLIDYRGLARDGGDSPPQLPHPRMAGRAFVLLPLAELDPAWRHPVTGTPISALIAALPPDQQASPIG